MFRRCPLSKCSIKSRIFVSTVFICDVEFNPRWIGSDPVKKRLNPSVENSRKRSDCVLSPLATVVTNYRAHSHCPSGSPSWINREDGWRICGILTSQRISQQMRIHVVQCQNHKSTLLCRFVEVALDESGKVDRKRSSEPADGRRLPALFKKLSMHCIHYLLCLIAIIERDRKESFILGDVRRVYFYIDPRQFVLKG